MDMKSAILAVGIACFSGAASAAFIDVTETNNGQILADSIVGSGVTVSNVFVNGAASQSGTFTNGGVIGLDSGIVLTTGDALLAESFNFFNASSGFPTSGSDADLAALVGEDEVFDANYLEFDFTTDTGELFFDFVFASEEYNEFVGTRFNDVLGFFVNGENIATTPEGLPVSINTVNCGNLTGSGSTNCDSYNDNSVFFGNAPAFDIAYDGFTDVFTASITGLSVIGTNHIKFAIADVGDASLDSAVFIGADSFSSTAVPIPASVWLLGTAMLIFAGVKRKYKQR